MSFRPYVTALVVIATVLPLTSAIFAQEDESEQEVMEEVVVTGIRSSLSSALEDKRDAANLIEVILAEDIGKLPDQNLAEVLENVTGIQITRTAGVGTGVQIRGTNANRTEINGVSTVDSGAGRTGIDFEDVSAAIIAAVEVTKAPEAKTVEGSVGGTINLRTIRSLDLRERIASIRFQGENSSLTTDSAFLPRLSGTFGDKWTTDSGEFGVVLSGSFTRQDVTAFRPRTDRDNSVAAGSGAASAQSFNFLPIQFLNQDYDNFEYDTKNFASSFEWAPNDEMTWYFDLVNNDQERRQESSRVQGSGVSSLRNASIPDAFETIDFGTIDGRIRHDLGSIEAALRGVIGVDLDVDDDDPNLRFSSDTNSRLTESRILRVGTDWQRDRWSGTAEVSTSTSDSTTPSFNTTLNFINPNVPLDPGGANDNSTPFRYDLSDGTLSWAVAFGEPGAPTVTQLLDPANVVLRDVNISQDIAESGEDAMVFDFSYDLEWGSFTSVDFGYRYSKATNFNNDIRTNRGLRRMSDSPRGNLFSELLVPGPDNFNEADGRELYIGDFLLIDPERVASDPDGVLAILNAAITAHGGSRSVNQPTSTVTAFFDIEEKTNALYAQVNFEAGIFRGNFGVRHIATDVNSTGNSVINDVVTPATLTGSYSFVLPRFNVAANVRDDVVLRAAWAKDIRRPNFNSLSTSTTFSTSPNPPVSIGNPELEPEEVNSIDFTAEWYFAPTSVLSVGYFRKVRTGLFVRTQEDPFEDPVTGFRDITDPCEDGGIFNPIADINVFGPAGVGVCVPVATTVNGAGETTQSGIEIAFQYDLSQFEDELGWASGFGFIVNLTNQDFAGGDTFLNPTSRATAAFALTSTGRSGVSLRGQLIDLSGTAYNLTTYYEKYRISARMRYTWREAYRSTDFGSTSSFPWGFPVVQEDRGQLNASVSYDVNDNLNVGIEAVNLTESDVRQSCVNEGALVCFQGLTDRRITLGASYSF
ncbi:MAG: TonB-dependent receptor [Gammaproteobacteria bacterium]|nr:TonB-dependent receptor [Gammaproteobacteria bacterium]